MTTLNVFKAILALLQAGSKQAISVLGMLKEDMENKPDVQRYPIFWTCEKGKGRFGYIMTEGNKTIASKDFRNNENLYDTDTVHVGNPAHIKRLLKVKVKKAKKTEAKKVNKKTVKKAKVKKNSKKNSKRKNLLK